SILSAVFLSRPLLQLLEWLLSPLRRLSGQTGRLGRQQLRQDLQLALFLQRLPRRTSFPPESPLDENGSVPSKHRRSAKRGRRSRHQARPHARLPRSESAQALWRNGASSFAGIIVDRTIPVL